MHEPLTMQLVSELMPRLHAAFPRNLGQQNPTLMLDTYRNGLRGLSGQSVRHAVDRVIQEDSYFPKVARLRELASAWQRHNAPASDARQDVPWNRCAVCGVEAKPMPIVRDVRDETGKVVYEPAARDSEGKLRPRRPLTETVESTALYMLHDRRAHHVFEALEGSA